jgi:membrane protease YdiL (CAAX protease family)
MVLYLHFWISMRATGESFGDLAAGAVVSPVTILSQGLVGMVLGIPLLLVLIRFVWRRSREWVGLRFEIRPFFDGTALGLAMAFVVVGISFLTGIARVTGMPTRFSLTGILMIMAGQLSWIFFKALLEEVVFRGMATREFALRWGWPVATLVGGVFFSVTHMVAMIPILTPQVVVGIFIAGQVANALFVVLYLRGRSLSLPFGFHFGWNFALAALVGTTLSGTERSFGLFHVELAGNTLLTGGDFGIEMSIISIVLFFVLMICFIKIPYRRQVQMLSSQPESKH